MPDLSAPAPKTAVRIAPKSRVLAKDRMRSAGLRVTAARIKILSALLSANRALSYHDIRAIVAIDRVTLYRVLSSLTNAGLAHMITSDDRVSRYGVTNPTANGDSAVDVHAGAHRYRHGHFHCTLCSRMFCLENDSRTGLLSNVFMRSSDGARNKAPEPLMNILRKTLGAGFKSHDIELIVKGWCADCAH